MGEKKRLTEHVVHDTDYRAGETVGITGAAGSFKIRHFTDLGDGRVEVEVFGGLPSKGMIRTFDAERLAPPDGSTAGVAAREKELAPDAIREAIARDGRVEVKLENPDDPAERKRTSNLVFNRAYSLGLKGKFKVKVVDGVVIGERKEDA